MQIIYNQLQMSFMFTHSKVPCKFTSKCKFNTLTYFSITFFNNEKCILNELNPSVMQVD